MFTFGFEYNIIESQLIDCIKNINKFFAKIVGLLCENGWITEITNSSEVVPIIDAVKGVALTLCALFFLIDFFTKSMNLQWIKWENVLMFCIKMVFAKVLIDKAPELCEMIYSGFSSIITTALDSTGTLKIIRLDSTTDKVLLQDSFVAFGLLEDEAKKLLNPPTVSFFDLTPLMLSVKISIMSMLYTIILCICFVIILGRMFELTVYTIIAPIPLATFASDGVHDIGKSFLKSYAAVSIQALVMVIMVIAYSAITTKFIPTLPSGGIYGFAGLINVLALALGIMQSGNWAKRICGAM